MQSKTIHPRPDLNWKVLLMGALGLMTLPQVLAQGPTLVFRVETATTEERVVSRKLELTGTIEPDREIEISSMVGGRIVSMSVDEGDVVALGDLLFEIDDREEIIARKRAQGELEKARAELKKMRAGYLPQEVQQAVREVETAESRMKAAQDDWDRLRPLVEQKVISAIEATRARSATEVAQAEYERAKARLDLLEEGFRSEEVTIAEADVSVREAEVEEIDRRIEDHHVRASAAGAVVELHRDSGEWISEGDATLTLVVVDPMELHLEIPQSQIGLVKPGQKAAMRVDGFPDQTFEAVVQTIIPRASQTTRNFPVILEIRNPDQVLAAGMFARAEIELGSDLKGLFVPREAVQYRDDRLVVYKVLPLPDNFKLEAPPTGEGGSKGGPPTSGAAPNGRAQEVEIRITSETAAGAIIESTNPDHLHPLDKIVTLGGSDLRDGSLLLRLN